MSAFGDLDVYRRAAAFADEVYWAVGGWSSFDRFALGGQLVRATDSIRANIAEAFGRWSAKDQRRMLYMARGSAYETEHWLERAAVRGLWYRMTRSPTPTGCVPCSTNSSPSPEPKD